MIDWLTSKAYDDWKTTPPDAPDTDFVCGCGCEIFPDDVYYEIEGEKMCEECAKEWLEEQKHYATYDECFKENE